MRTKKGFAEQTVARWRHVRLGIIAGMILAALTACGQSKGGSHRGNNAGDAAWTVHVRKVHDALAKKDISGAEWAWQKAYVTALRSRSWKSMVEVGDAALRIGEVVGFRKATADRARQSYLVALIRARFQNSLDGVLRTARAFAALGDRERVDQCLQIAKSLAAPATVTRVHVPSALDDLTVDGT